MLSSLKKCFIFFLALMYGYCQQICNPSTNYGFSIGLCKCPPSGILIDGWCQTCKVSNCLLCSVTSDHQCDVCATGYILDQFTQSICVPKINNSTSCTSATCLCSPYEISIDGHCHACTVPNCLLCQVSQPSKCDICHSGFILDKLTSSECVPMVNQSKSCQSSSCACTPYEVYVNKTCVSCSVPNCRLCAIGNNNQCDVCKVGYVLDDLTKTICVAAVGKNATCTENSCGCTPYQVRVNDTCLSCSVKNCSLCAVGNPQQCDVCNNGYVLDHLTKSLCVLAINSSLSCTAKSCSCSPYQSKINGVCYTCQMPNCRLCSLSNPLQCDICSPGYILDIFTHSECVPGLGQQKVCTMSNSTCMCSPYQISSNGQCLKCEVAHCLLCQVDNSQGCDICYKFYTYNPETKQCNQPVCEQNMIWVNDHCQCDQRIAFINQQGKCQKIDEIKKLSIALGVGIPLVFISVAMMIVLRLAFSNQVEQNNSIVQESAKNFNELSKIQSGNVKNIVAEEIVKQ